MMPLLYGIMLHYDINTLHKDIIMHCTMISFFYDILMSWNIMMSVCYDIMMSLLLSPAVAELITITPLCVSVCLLATNL